MVELSKVISMRIAESDDELLTKVASKIRVAKKMAVAREALRRGLEIMDAEQSAAPKKKAKP
jgi:negative regulator of replication initiation